MFFVPNQREDFSSQLWKYQKRKTGKLRILLDRSGCLNLYNPFVVCSWYLECSLSVYFIYLFFFFGGDHAFLEEHGTIGKKGVFKKVHACTFEFTTNEVRKTAMVSCFPTLGVYCVHLFLCFYLCEKLSLKKFLLFYIHCF